MQIKDLTLVLLTEIDFEIPVIALGRSSPFGDARLRPLALNKRPLPRQLIEDRLVSERGIRRAAQLRTSWASAVVSHAEVSSQFLQPGPSVDVRQPPGPLRLRA